MRYAPFLLALAAFGCSEAQICRSQATAPLRSLERQIDTAQQNVARGYELIERPGRVEYSPAYCPHPPRPPGPRPPWPPGGPLPGSAMDRGEHRAEVSRRGPISCPSPFGPETVYETRPINVEAEKAKLASLISQRDRLLPETQRALANCPVD